MTQISSLAFTNNLFVNKLQSQDRAVVAFGYWQMNRGGHPMENAFLFYFSHLEMGRLQDLFPAPKIFEPHTILYSHS